MKCYLPPREVLWKILPLPMRPLTWAVKSYCMFELLRYRIVLGEIQSHLDRFLTLKVHRAVFLVVGLVHRQTKSYRALHRDLTLNEMFPIMVLAFHVDENDSLYDEKDVSEE